MDGAPGRGFPWTDGLYHWVLRQADGAAMPVLS